MANAVMLPTDLRQRIAASFGATAVTIPPSVAGRLRWRHMTPEASALGWPIVWLIDLDWRDLLAIPQADLQWAAEIAKNSLKPSSPADCITATARLRAVARHRASVESDETLALTVYAEKLARYPDSAVAAACEKWLETSPFWPSVSEILQACEWAMQPRRALVQTLEKALTDQQHAPQARANRIEELKHVISSHGRITADSRAAQQAEDELAAIEDRPALQIAAFESVDSRTLQ